jgi:hypothetical protein
MMKLEDVKHEEDQSTIPGQPDFSTPNRIRFTSSNKQGVSPDILFSSNGRSHKNKTDHS